MPAALPPTEFPPIANDPSISLRQSEELPSPMQPEFMDPQQQMEMDLAAQQRNRVPNLRERAMAPSIPNLNRQAVASSISDGGIFNRANQMAEAVAVGGLVPPVFLQNTPGFIPATEGASVPQIAEAIAAEREGSVQAALNRLSAVDNTNPKKPVINPDLIKAGSLVTENMLLACDHAHGIKSVCLRYFNACGAHADGDIGECHEPETHLIPIILQVQTLLLTALAIVREREQGTMEQLIVTPIKSWELMLGKIIPYLLVSVLNMLALLWLGDLLFGVTVAGNYLELVGLSTVFIIGSLGMGVLISNLAQSQMQAIYLVVFVILIPAIILSGLMYPRSGMPLISYVYSALLPVTHFLEITRAIMLRGVNANLLWSSTLPLIILSVVYFTASVLAFRKRL